MVFWPFLAAFVLGAYAGWWGVAVVVVGWTTWTYHQLRRRPVRR